MIELLEMIHRILESGLTWATGLSVVLVYLKWHEGKKKKRAYDRMERKIDDIGKEMGLTWVGQPNVSLMDQQSFKKLLESSQVGIRWVNRRRGKQMLNRKWIAGLIVYILYFIKQITGYEITDELANNLTDLTLLIIGMIPMILNMVKKKEVKPNDAAKYTGDSGPAV